MAAEPRSVVRRRSLVLDAGVALLCVFVLWFPLVREPSWQLVGQLLLICAVLAGVVLRWRWPVPAFAMVAAATATGLVAGVASDPFVAAAWALYPVALARSERVARLAFVATTAVAAVGLLLLISGSTQAAGWVRYALLSVLVLGGSWALGMSAREQRIQAGHVARARAENAAAEERLRIARELHDIVSHSLGSIGVRAGVARHVGTVNADQLRELLGEIETTSRAALNEMGGLVRALRVPGGEPLLPQPGLADVGDLVASAERAGVSCALAVTGAEQVGKGAGAAVYRIVQESLTNVVRHAPGSRCSVRIVGAVRSVGVQVADDGPGLGHRRAGAGEHDGHGLIGMRERALARGGTFSAGNRDEGGFVVRAELPQPGARTDED